LFGEVWINELNLSKPTTFVWAEETIRYPPKSLSFCVRADDLEGKVKWLDNYQKVKQLKESLVWLPVWERDKRAHVPEVCVKISLTKV